MLIDFRCKWLGLSLGIANKGGVVRLTKLLLARLWPTSLTGFAPREFWGCSFFPSAKLSDKGECIISFTLYRRVSGRMRGEEKLNSILDSTRGFRKFRGIAAPFPIAIQSFRFCRARRTIREKRRANNGIICKSRKFYGC